MKKLFLILALAIGLAFSGIACVTTSQNTGAEVNEYRLIGYQYETGESLDVLIPWDWPNFFVHPYEFEMMVPITNKYVVKAFRNKNVFEDVYVIGVVQEKDNSKVVNILKGIDDTYWLYMHFGPCCTDPTQVRPHKVTREEFVKNVEHWEERDSGRPLTNGPYGWGG